MLYNKTRALEFPRRYYTTFTNKKALIKKLKLGDLVIFVLKLLTEKNESKSLFMTEFDWLNVLTSKKVSKKNQP